MVQLKFPLISFYLLMKYFTKSISFLLLSFFISCQGELFPFDLGEPLILEATPNFDSQKLNQLCEINYFDESIFLLSANGGNLATSEFYKSMEEWNLAQSNVRFKFQKEPNKCNLIFQTLYYDTILPVQRKKDEFGVIRINGELQNPFNPNSPSRIEMITKNSSIIYLPNGFAFYEFNSK